MDADTVARVRRFNRTVTERVGALDESYLDRGRPLGETRLLWEIGPDGADVRDLRRRLGLDAGYASRLLRSLESARLVVVEPGSADRRVRRARLTADGRAERAELDRLSDGLAASMLEPLEQSQRARLVAAMDEVERLMRASLVTITVDRSGRRRRALVHRAVLRRAGRPVRGRLRSCHQHRRPDRRAEAAHRTAAGGTPPSAAGGLRGAQDPPGPARRAEADVGIARGARPRPRPEAAAGAGAAGGDRPAPTPFAWRRTGR